MIASFFLYSIGNSASVTVTCETGFVGCQRVPSLTRIDLFCVSSALFVFAKFFLWQLGALTDSIRYHFGLTVWDSWLELTRWYLLFIKTFSIEPGAELNAAEPSFRDWSWRHFPPQQKRARVHVSALRDVTRYLTVNEAVLHPWSGAIHRCRPDKRRKHVCCCFWHSSYENGASLNLLF